MDYPSQLPRPSTLKIIKECRQIQYHIKEKMQKILLIFQEKMQNLLESGERKKRSTKLLMSEIILKLVHHDTVKRLRVDPAHCDLTALHRTAASLAGAKNDALVGLSWSDGTEKIALTTNGDFQDALLHSHETKAMLRINVETESTPVAPAPQSTHATHATHVMPSVPTMPAAALPAKPTTNTNTGCKMKNIQHHMIALVSCAVFGPLALRLGFNILWFSFSIAGSLFSIGWRLVIVFFIVKTLKNMMFRLHFKGPTLRRVRPCQSHCQSHMSNFMTKVHSLTPKIAEKVQCALDMMATGSVETQSGTSRPPKTTQQGMDSGAGREVDAEAVMLAQAIAASMATQGVHTATT